MSRAQVRRRIQGAAKMNWMNEQEEQAKDTVSKEDILSQVGPFQIPQHYQIIPLSIWGC